MIQQAGQHLEGKFTCLRPLRRDDAPQTYGWRTSRRAEMLGGVPDSVRAQEEWILSRPSSEYNWIIEIREEGTAVGMLSLVDVDLTNRHAQTARFLIGDEGSTRGKPIAVEAMLLLYDFAFGELGLHRLYGFIAAKNKQMLRWQEFLGMTREGVWRDHLSAGAGFEDAVLLGILAHEYAQRARLRMTQMISIAGTGGHQR